MRVVAYFDSLGALERAAGGTAPALGWRVVTICSPAYHEKVVDLARALRSPVPGVALAGGVLGALSGWVLTVGTVREWPQLIVGGKPLVAVPSFLIVIFELAILLAGLAAGVTFVAASARARRGARGAADATTTDNRFSLLLEATPAAANPDALIRHIGAIAWRQT